MLSRWILLYLRYMVRYSNFKGCLHMSLGEDKKERFSYSTFSDTVLLQYSILQSINLLFEYKITNEGWGWFTMLHPMLLEGKISTKFKTLFYRLLLSYPFHYFLLQTALKLLLRLMMTSFFSGSLLLISKFSWRAISVWQRCQTR